MRYVIQYLPVDEQGGVTTTHNEEIVDVISATYSNEAQKIGWDHPVPTHLLVLTRNTGAL